MDSLSGKAWCAVLRSPGPQKGGPEPRRPRLQEVHDQFMGGWHRAGAQPRLANLLSVSQKFTSSQICIPTVCLTRAGFARWTPI